MTIMRRGIAVCALCLLSACATAPVPTPSTAVPARTVPRAAATTASLIGQTASQLEAAFGPPASQVAEGTARKLQYSGPVCVLDAYFYPSAAGAEPVVTHIDTRRPTGEDFDRAGCVAALRLR